MTRNGGDMTGNVNPTNRGKPRYVVMDIAQYERLREAELFSAWQEARAAVSSGDSSAETAEEHIARLKKELASDAV